jgi:trans-aconitate methyltransferase
LTLQEAVGDGGKLVHLNCGDGSLSQHLHYQSYVGYDASLENILLAKHNNPTAEFAMIDVLNFVSDEEYDTLLMEAASEYIALRVMRLWKAKRYVFIINGIITCS